MIWPAKMNTHAIFAAPFLMDATIRFIAGAAQLPGVRLSVISQDPAERLPADVRQRLAGHWRVDNALDPGQIVQAAKQLEQRIGKASRLIGCRHESSRTTMF